MRRLSIDKRNERHAAAACARVLDLPSIRWRDVLRYWNSVNRQYAFGRWRWARRRIARERDAS